MRNLTIGGEGGYTYPNRDNWHTMPEDDLDYSDVDDSPPALGSFFVVEDKEEVLYCLDHYASDDGYTIVVAVDQRGDVHWLTGTCGCYVAEL